VVVAELTTVAAILEVLEAVRVHSLRLMLPEQQDKEIKAVLAVLLGLHIQTVVVAVPEVLAAITAEVLLVLVAPVQCLALLV
jgi:hypothetical protein